MIVIRFNLYDTHYYSMFILYRQIVVIGGVAIRYFCMWVDKGYGVINSPKNNARRGYGALR